MNERTRWMLERYFDGELSGERANAAYSLCREPEARRYLERLTGLRGLAVRHARVGRAVVVPPRPRSRHSRAWAIALAASVGAIVVGRFWTHFVPPDRAQVIASLPSTGFEPGPSPPVRTRDIALYTWANTTERRPDRVARALLTPGTSAGKRPARIEMLALLLANGSTAVAGTLEPLAVVHRPALGGRSNNERHVRRTRAVPPRD
jgi:hypothetical protein